MNGKVDQYQLWSGAPMDMYLLLDGSTDGLYLALEAGAWRGVLESRIL